MSFALLIHGVQFPDGPWECPETGHYVQAFNPEEHSGRGSFLTTLAIERAAHFPTAVDAFAFWRTQSKVKPYRDDGEPNRPLTAFTVEVVRVPA